MSLGIYPPVSPLLSGFVKCYWTLRTGAGQSRTQQRVIPSGEIQMMFHTGRAFEEQLPGGTVIKQPDSFVCGHKAVFSDVIAGEGSDMLAVVFYPWGLRAFVPFPVSETFNHLVSISEIFSTGVEALEEELRKPGSTIRGRIRAVERFLIERLRPENANMLQRVAESLQSLMNDTAECSVESLAENSFMSIRSLQRSYSDVAGAAPRYFIRIARLRRFLDSLHQQTDALLTGLAYKAGFADQAHLVHECRKLTGMSPGQIRSLMQAGEPGSG